MTSLLGRRVRVIRVVIFATALLVAGALIILGFLWAQSVGVIRTDSIPSLHVSGLQQLAAGHRRAEGSDGTEDPYVILGTNLDANQAIAALTVGLAAKGWRRQPRNDVPNAIRFWQGDHARYLSLGRFPGGALLDQPESDYGITAAQLSDWESHFQNLFILENVHFYSARPPFD